MEDDERRAFLVEGTRTGKVAWVSPQGNVHVAPIWFVLDGDDVLFTTHEDSAKGKAFTAGTRLSMVVDDQAPPYSYVKVDGTVSLGTWGRTGPRSSAVATASPASSSYGSARPS
jgi:nitroimidazol reductase NimA-like FMN-containing flavoprotein (pyridoxamine 5'-phosphate oxidase superfamily)